MTELGREFHVLSDIPMVVVEPGGSLFPYDVPWLYAVFAMLFVFFLFAMLSPFLLEIDQHIKKLCFVLVLIRCRYSLHNTVHKDKKNSEIKMDHLERPGCPLESPRRGVLGGKKNGMGNDPLLSVKVTREPRDSEAEIYTPGPSV
uniref:Uncharacterized protein n=1 Tax=Pongo abelii TaxID=9601 RepID=A0A8I5YQ22_PONAB